MSWSSYIDEETKVNLEKERNDKKTKIGIDVFEWRTGKFRCPATGTEYCAVETGGNEIGDKRL